MSKQARACGLWGCVWWVAPPVGGSHQPPHIYRGKLQVSFYGEEGIDAGGLTREWYSVLSREMFDQNKALFQAAADGATYQVRPFVGLVGVV